MWREPQICIFKCGIDFKGLSLKNLKFVYCGWSFFETLIRRALYSHLGLIADHWCSIKEVGRRTLNSISWSVYLTRNLGSNLWWGKQREETVGNYCPHGDKSIPICINWSAENQKLLTKIRFLCFIKGRLVYIKAPNQRLNSFWE